MAAFVAQRYYVEHGPSMVPGKVHTALDKYLPRKVLSGSKSREGWVQAIISSFNDQGTTRFVNWLLTLQCVLFCRILCSSPLQWDCYSKLER